MNYPNNPIVHLSVFKSGTHLTRRILTELTQLPFFEPPITRGRVNYQDPGQLVFKKGHFYSWHLVPTPEIRHRLHSANARPVLIVRNIYDWVVSAYHHFADNIDHEVGGGRNVDHHFQKLSFEKGLDIIIKGKVFPDFVWQGIGPMLVHTSLLITLAKECDSFLTSYDLVVENKRDQIRDLAGFLQIKLPEDRLDEIFAKTNFGPMRSEALASGQGSHFRVGKPGANRVMLTSAHISAIEEEIGKWCPALPSKEISRQLGLFDL